jgi:hypothetical protein
MILSQPTSRATVALNDIRQKSIWVDCLVPVPQIRTAHF